MGIYEKVFLPQLTKWTMSGGVFHKQRAKCLAGARGEVLEVGLGNGLNLAHYPEGVERVTGIDPSPQAERLARKEMRACPFPVEFHTGSAEDMPFADSSFDTVTVTWTLCTIPDPEQALREMARVLRPDGRMHFVGHGLSPDPGVARWQHRLNPIQKFIGGGCHLNRDIAGLIADAGFSVDQIENYYIKGPRTHTWLYLGTARAEGMQRG